MKIRENCYMLGLGSTGGKIYKEFVQRHYKGAAANGSEQDHKALGLSLIHISEPTRPY